MGADRRKRFDAVYVTDEVRLYEVCGARNGLMLLKDSARPNDPVITRTAKELKGLRSVLPK